jgi:hypothetical protein
VVGQKRRVAFWARRALNSLTGGPITMQLANYVKFREEKFGGVLFETLSEKVYTLNATAAAVIREVATGDSIAQITDRIRDRFEDPHGTIERDVAALISDLQKKGLIGGSAA